MDDCLKAIKLPKEQQNKWTENIDITPECIVLGKTVFVIKSKPKIKNWWYDYRLSFVDTKSFADHRVTYYKNNKQIKFIDKYWVPAFDKKDSRKQYWGYWYAKNLITGHETFAYVPKGVTKFNHKYKKRNLWSSQTLRRLPRIID